MTAADRERLAERLIALRYDGLAQLAAAKHVDAGLLALVASAHTALAALDFEEACAVATARYARGDATPVALDDDDVP